MLSICCVVLSRLLFSPRRSVVRLQALRRRVEQSLSLARRVRMLEKQLEDATGNRESTAGRLRVRPSGPPAP